MKCLVFLGLKVIGSACDQVQTNVSAMNRLICPEEYNNKKKARPKKQDGSIYKYKIRGVDIIHCYDLPHLIKVIRNNFMEKDLSHCISKRWSINDCDEARGHKQKTYTATWKDVADVYDFDLKGSHRVLKKITSEHIKPEKDKMKVCVATQVFSQSYGNAMLHFSKQDDFPKNCFGTAQVLFFFNDLVDSLNGSGKPQNGTLFGSINESSIHFAYWQYALSTMSKMSFVDRETKTPNNRSSVIYKFMSTIRGYIELTRICLKLGMKQVALRYE